MAKAELITKTGLKISIEGTPEEVASLVSKIEGGGTGEAKPSPSGHTRAKRTTTAKSGPADLIAGLIDGNFFRTPQELGAIRMALQEQGHYYPATTLSPLLLRFVRSKRIRRIKDKKRWQYVS